MLYFKILSIAGALEDQDWFSKNDLFLSFSYKNQVRRTRTLWNTERCRWEETFLLDLTDAKTIHMKLMDQDVWSKSEVLQEFSIPVYYGEIRQFCSNGLYYEMGDVHYKHRLMQTKYKNENDVLNAEKQDLIEQNNAYKSTNETMYQKNSEVIKKYKSTVDKYTKMVDDYETKTDNMRSTIQKLRDVNEQLASKLESIKNICDIV